MMLDGSNQKREDEIRKHDLDARLVADSISQQLERRVMFRRAMKRAVGNAMRLGALGIRVQVGGRLNGADIARSEWYHEGRRSEEHTSELQSRGHLVCRLLLEKKKKEYII